MYLNGANYNFLVKDVTLPKIPKWHEMGNQWEQKRRELTYQMQNKIMDKLNNGVKTIHGAKNHHVFSLLKVTLKNLQR